MLTRSQRKSFECLRAGFESSHPIFSAPERFWKATPATLLAMIAGPPLFPGFMAASICIAINWVAPCTYCVGSTLDTTPLVTEMLSPPALSQVSIRS